MIPATPELVRTAAGLKAARQALGFSADQLAKAVRVDDGRTVRRWEAGENEIPGPVSVILEIAMSYLQGIATASEQIAMLEAGELRGGGSDGAKRVDETGGRIIQWKKALAEYKSALEILTRHPPNDGTAAQQVRWYTLRRTSDLQEWSLPGETSVAAALAYFKKDLGLHERLVICGSDDEPRDFILEQRQVWSRPFGASWRPQAGEMVKHFDVRRET